MDMNVQKHLDLLGMKACERVSGITGVITSVAFDAFGCIQAVVGPKANEHGKIAESRFYDVARLKVTGKTPVMPVPDFDLKPFDLLCMKVSDIVQGFDGTVTSICFDLDGRIQAVVMPKADADGKVENSRFVDIPRLKVTSKQPITPVPNFDFGPVAEGKKGAAEKPASPRMPRQG